MSRLRYYPDPELVAPHLPPRTAHEKRVEEELAEVNRRLQRVEHELAWRRRYDPLRPFDRRPM